MKRPLSEIVFNVVLIGLVGYFLFESYSIRESSAGGSLSPAFFPKAICVLLIVLLGFSLLSGIREMIFFKKEESNSSILTETVKSILGWLSVLLLLVVYAVLLEPLGYIISTALLVFFVVGTLVVLSANDESRVSGIGIAKLIAFSIVTSFAIFFLFSEGFGIRLPTLGVMGI